MVSSAFAVRYCWAPSRSWSLITCPSDSRWLLPAVRFRSILPTRAYSTDCRADYGKGPEKCIDAVGLEAHATRSLVYDRVKQAMWLETDRAHVLREMIYVCRPAGILSIPGVYGGLVIKFYGGTGDKGLTVRTGQTHVNRWTDDLLRRIDEGQIDPSFVITHAVDLAQGPEMYQTFRDKRDGCVKVILKAMVTTQGGVHEHTDETPFPLINASRCHSGQAGQRFEVVKPKDGVVSVSGAASLGRALGMPQRHNKIRVRCRNGISALSDNPTRAIWSRVVGDVLDFSKNAFALKRHPCIKRTFIWHSPP